MAAHRYWGLLLTARPGASNGISLAEVQMRATSGGANQCTGGTAGGAATNGTSAANAFDGNAATHWFNGSASSAILLSYDFGTAVTVVEIVATTSGAGLTPDRPGSTYGPAACWVKWSDDGTNWYFGGPAVDLASLGNAASFTILSVSDNQPGATVSGSALRLSPGWPSGPAARVLVGGLQFDAIDGGAYRVAGDVGIDGTTVTLVKRRVRLFTRLSGRLVREAWSDAVTGAFEFRNLRNQEYLLVTDDYTRYYNAVAADAVVPVP